MDYFAPRTCTEIGQASHESGSRRSIRSSLSLRDGISKSELETLPSGNKGASKGNSLSLEALRDRPAYVLLGAPGAGKTRAFKREAKLTGGDYMSARDFLTFDERPESKGSTLFIDGLDERRAGLLDGRTPLNEIRRRLIQLGRPHFRLSCREADWFGTNDRDHLKAVSPGGEISEFRLDPLPEKEVGRILKKNFGIRKPGVFIASADEQGIGELLGNPQMLEMLVAAVNQSGQNEFPKSRTETFDLACRKLLDEHNIEHQLATQERFSADSLMDAAGKLCAVQLLTGCQGYRLPGSASHPSFPGLHRIALEDGERLRHVVRTKLFHAPLEEGHIEPIHRQVAEFLAARYLTSLIRKGLPLRRVLSLITGYDDVIVSELRGLSAWLAAHSKPERKEIMALDPLGTVLYGDVRNFSVDEKISLLEQLSQMSKKNPWSIRRVGMDARCGEIATHDVAGEIRLLLKRSSRDDTWQSFLLFVVKVLRFGDSLPGTAQPLLDILKDRQIWPSIKHAAIHAFVRQQGEKAKAHAQLQELLDELYADEALDPEHELISWLLEVLHPEALQGSEILQYLRDTRKSGGLSDYESFWTYVVPRRSTAEALGLLLDGLAGRDEELGESSRSMHQPAFFLKRLPRIWLSAYLEKCGEEFDRRKLFDWLGLAARVGDWLDDGGLVDARSIAAWIEARPELHKWLLALGLQRCIDREECADESEFANCMYMQWERRFYKARKPKNFGRWCIEKALAANDGNARAWLIREAVDWVDQHDHNSGTSIEEITQLLAPSPELMIVFDERLNQRKANLGRDSAYLHKRRMRRRRNQEKERNNLKPHEIELRENQAAPGLLYNLALVYLGGNRHVSGRNPRERLNNLLGDDPNLVEAVLDGLRESIDRSDVPSDDEVIKLHCQSKRHILALPIVAGLEERATIAPSNRISLDDDKLRLALAIHYTEPHWSVYIGGDRSVDQKSLWFPPLLKTCPNVVAEVLIKFARASFRKGAGHVDGLYDLANSQDHSEVARLAALPLLEVFPVRCREAQLQDLRHLLHSAALIVGGALSGLIDRKLAFRSMNPAQRVYWLAAGLLVSPDKYIRELDAYVSGSNRRIEPLERFLVALFDMPPGLFELLDVASLEFLIRRVGAKVDADPASWESEAGEGGEGGVVGQGMESGVRVRDFVLRLASIRSEAATAALQRLLIDDKLIEWRPQLLYAAYQQGQARREGEFQHANLKQTLSTLRNGKPAKAADLAALAEDHLRKISTDIRDGTTSDWRQYWNVDSYNRPVQPRPEDSCRERLLSSLKQSLLHLGIDAQPEGHYADNKRADIRMFCNGFNVPVEIKRSCHPDVWSAIDNQLVAKYARDPGAQGYGIYLVFWFGNTEKCRPTADAAGVPKSAAVLEQRLKESLSEESRRKITVCVIDVAAPGK